jgi:hypothetical protein
MGEWESLVGYTAEPPAWMLLEMANASVQTLADFGRYMTDVQTRDYQGRQGLPGSIDPNAYPWATYGLTKDEYASASSIFGTTYKDITGTDISPDALASAFRNPRDPTGGLLSGSQYKQQLMNDAAIQKQFGWVKHGLDYSAWTQQKLSMRGAFGRDINDAEAATILQYNRASSGANMSAVARASGQQQQDPAGAGVAQSVAR